MRYQDWDVLLFPQNSRAPIQEFKVQCHVMADIESPLAHSSTFIGVPSASEGPIITQLPILTAFVPSLHHNAPFRVSIHSWERPNPSRMIESMVRLGDVILFEARVYIDGVLVADSVFDHSTVWPLVLDMGAQQGTAYEEGPLRFPQFHREILHQSHWEAGELLGRIRIVIAEGFSHDISIPRGKHSYLFDRVKDVVAFSFQHAPLHILELSGIAWPNPGMWKRAPDQPVHSGAPPGTRNPQPGYIHAHSPHQLSDWAARAMLPPIAPASDPTSAHSRAHIGLPNISGLPLAEDPFTDLRRNNGVFRRSKRSMLDDMTMPDCDSTSTEISQAYSNMTGLSDGHQKGAGGAILINEASLADIAAALSPEKARNILTKTWTPSKDGDSGILQVPTNSPSSNEELPTHFETTTQGSSPQIDLDGCGRALQCEVVSKNMPSLQISTESPEVLLARTVTVDASPVNNIRGKKSCTLDDEGSPKSGAASFEPTKPTNTSFKVAVASMSGPIVISNHTNRSRPDSNGSKRKRSSLDSPKSAMYETKACSPTKKAPRGA